MTTRAILLAAWVLVGCSGSAVVGGGGGSAGAGPGGAGVGGVDGGGGLGTGGEGVGGTGGAILGTCPELWQLHTATGRCYRTMTSIDYNGALTICNEIGGALFVPLTDLEFQVAVDELCPNSDRCWIAATDRDTEGIFLWSDGTPVVFPPGVAWGAGEPSDDATAGVEDCLLIDEDILVDDNGLADETCENYAFALCVREAE